MIHRTYNQGFTLVELMVSVALFAIIVVAASSGLVASVARERSVRAEVALQKSMYTFLDQLESEVHLARRIGCGSLEANCLAGGDTLVLENQDLSVVAYTLSDNEITRTVDGGTPVTALASFGGSIDDWTVYVRGAGVGNSDQYSLAVSVSGIASTDKALMASRYITPYALDTND